MSRKLGLAALTILELPHHEQVSIAAQAGYSHVGLRLRPVPGQPVWHDVRVAEIKENTVVMDFNHPLAGKTLFFNVTVTEVKPANP